MLADCRFDIKDSAGLVCDEVKRPAFAGGRCQLDEKLGETRRLAHLWLLGWVEMYTVLSSPVPLSLVVPCEGEKTYLIKCFVCCALTSMCPGVCV